MRLGALPLALSVLVAPVAFGQGTVSTVENGVQIIRPAHPPSQSSREPQAMAGTGGSGLAPAGPELLEKKNAEGTLIGVRPDSVALRLPTGGVLSIGVTPYSQVLRNGQEVPLSSVRDGAPVRVDYAVRNGAPTLVTLQVERGRLALPNAQGMGVP